MVKKELNNLNDKFKIFREYYIPLASVGLAALAILANILITYINSRSALEMKQFEVTYLEKRKSYADILTSVSNIKSYMFELSFNANTSYYDKYYNLFDEIDRDLDSISKNYQLKKKKATWEDDLKSLNKRLIDSIYTEFDILTYRVNFIQPFIDDKEQDRTNLINKTTEFIVKTKEFLNKFIEKVYIKDLNDIYRNLNKIPKYKSKELIDTIYIETTGQITMNYIAPYHEYILNDVYEQLFVNN